jgi:hypothetical protein
MVALVLQLVRVFFPRIAAVLDVACPAKIAGQFLLRFGDVNAIVEPQAVLYASNRRGEVLSN